MPKPLTAKQLGIPSGYRLSESNISNITAVSIRHKFGKEMLSLANLEAKLLIKTNKQIYKEKDIVALETLVKKISGESGNATIVEDEQQFMINATIHQLGGNYVSYSYQGGIIVMDKFKSMLQSMTNLEFNKKFNITSERHSNDYLWRKEFCKIVVPRGGLQVSHHTALERLTTKTKTEVINHFDKVKDLEKRIAEHVALVRGITNIYTSATKLCNDAPEFVEWINDAKIYNKDGRKCTDVSTHDMIAQLRQNK